MTYKKEQPDLLNDFHHGSVDAFNQIYTSLQGQLFYFAAKLTGEEGLAADLVTEGFIKLWQQKPAFQNMSALKSWMFTVVQNAGLNARAADIRHNAAHREIALFAGTSETMEQVIIRSEALQAIYEQIAGLPSQCRQVMESTFISGKTTREIAEEMNLAEQTIINQKNRGIKLVRSALLKNGMLSSAVIWSALSMLDTKFF